MCHLGPLSDTNKMGLNFTWLSDSTDTQAVGVASRLEKMFHRPSKAGWTGEAYSEPLSARNGCVLGIAGVKKEGDGERGRCRLGGTAACNLF